MLTFYLGGIAATTLLGYLIHQREKGYLNSFDWFDTIMTGVLWLPIMVWYVIKEVING